ncbi:hypothetical protein CIB95_11655 [Lottiidibacillus patelloidae]|uniref:Uncharacterized protein n=1 Tax=Lottiidibacillus patelloidae TaxID=2670334 RepID=A0A263BRT5_9BACI|nr:hypothetical protein [Lottiidibacillus patelloidae]OZM56423.1 hypothetical protein CIB95_11655 [Lottiidibacillus patelloidae]
MYKTNPFDKLINYLKENNLLAIVLQVMLLFLLIGVNAQQRNQYSDGFVFLLITILILIIDKKTAMNFFGTSYLSLLIVIHINIFQLNSVVLISTFMSYIIFKNVLIFACLSLPGV